MFKLTNRQDESSSSFETPQPCRQLPFSEIQLATQNFDESLVIGHGGFGKVYKGTITSGENLLTAAIKRLESTSNQGADEFWAEVKMLSNLRHCHLVSLIGYCNDGQEMVLVYEYLPRGTLEDHLHKRLSSLTWIRRLKICIGAARGLDYLHTGTGIKHGVIHRDVKSSNILLDESWAAKISDFGLSKIGPTNQPSTYVNTLVKGTFGYLDPDYFSTGRLTRKSDVYAFGVVLFEVLCGKRAVDRTLDEEQWGLARWVQDSIKEGRLKQIVDSDIRGRISPECLKEFAQLADRCLHSHPKKRPTMAEVVVGLEFVLALQEKANKTLQTAGMKLFGRKVPMLVFPYNWENSGIDGDISLKSLKLYLDTIQDENQIFHRFDFDSINVATENFSEANKLPRVNYYDMYKGRLQNGQDIAIAETSSNTPLERSAYMHEASILVKLEHDNLVKLLGYCIEGTKLFLIFEFAVHASLHNLIFDRVSTLLDCNKRYKILLGVARVLLYLHKHAPFRFIDCALNPENILLDESLDPKLSYFLSATIINETDFIDTDDRVRGYWGYTAPEYFISCHLSTKTDVFSFGVLVLITITGLRPCDFIPVTYENIIGHFGRIWLDGTYSNMIDSRLDANSSLMKRLVDIVVFCTQNNPEDRPTMEEVVNMLLGTSSLVSEMRARTIEGLKRQARGTYNDTSDIEECKWIISADDYDTSAVEEFMSDLDPR